MAISWCIFGVIADIVIYFPSVSAGCLPYYFMSVPVISFWTNSAVLGNHAVVAATF